MEREEEIETRRRPERERERAWSRESRTPAWAVVCFVPGLVEVVRAQETCWDNFHASVCLSVTGVIHLGEHQVTTCLASDQLKH